MSPSSTANMPRVGIGVIIWNQNQVLLGKRLSEGDVPCWQFPGGHLEAGESVLQCAEREVLEETGLQVTDLRDIGHSTQPFLLNNIDYVAQYVSANWREGEPQVMEPDKCECWQWFDYRELPQPLFTPITLLLQQCDDLHVACFAAGIPASGHR